MCISFSICVVTVTVASTCGFGLIWPRGRSSNGSSRPRRSGGSSGAAASRARSVPPRSRSSARAAALRLRHIAIHARTNHSVTSSAQTRAPPPPSTGTSTSTSVKPAIIWPSRCRRCVDGARGMGSRRLPLCGALLDFVAVGARIEDPGACASVSARRGEGGGADWRTGGTRGWRRVICSLAH
jgi:hypothetical protein